MRVWSKLDPEVDTEPNAKLDTELSPKLEPELNWTLITELCRANFYYQTPFWETLKINLLCKLQVKRLYCSQSEKYHYGE